MKFTINGQIVENSKSTKITIPKKKIISCNDYIYNKNNSTSVKTYCPNYYTEDYLWNYFEIKIDFSKLYYNNWPLEFILVFYPYHSGSTSNSIIPYLATLNYEFPNDFNANNIIIGGSSLNAFGTVMQYFNNFNTNAIPTAVLKITNSNKSFDLLINSPKFSGYSDPEDTTWTGSLPKVENQTNILTLGIGSKGNKANGSFDPESATLESTQFVFINTEDDNLDHAFKIRDILTTNQSIGGNTQEVKNSHDYAWKFGIVNQLENDLEVDVASYKKDISPMGEKLAKAVSGSLDGEAIEEPPVEYDIKQILPLIKDRNFNEDFLKYNELKIRCKYNYDILNNRGFEPLIEEEAVENHGIFTLGSKYLPLEFYLDLGTNIDNIVGISFNPGVDSTQHFSTCCSVKDYEIHISQDGINYQLLIKNTYDISKGKDEKYTVLFKPEEVSFDPVTFRYLKIKILNIHLTVIGNYNGFVGFSKLRIYTNTKNLYNKEDDQSISNYKDDTFNQVITKPEWDQKSKEDKIALNKQASFDNPPITKIKNELNDFRIITNSNNISLYEKS